MKRFFHPTKPLFREIVLCLLLLGATGMLYPVSAQNSISGPTCVLKGGTYNYTLSAYYSGSSVYHYSISNGVLTTGGSSGQHTGPGVSSISIIWNSNLTTGVISLTSPNGLTQLNVSGTSAPTMGSITSGGNQNINYNIIPATITCSAASGGGCGSPNYNYLWQSSTNNIAWGNTSTAGLSISFSTGLTQTMYYRLMLTETKTGVIEYSNAATVTVYQQLTPGTITPSSSTISPGTNPGQLTGSLPTGGDGNYAYAWWSSPTNSPPWTQVASSQSYTPGVLTNTMYYRRDVSDLGSTVSAYASVTVMGGVIPADNPTGNLNSDKNWILSSGYDPTGITLSQEKDFFDNSGRPMQQQSKVFYRKDANNVFPHVLARQTIRDAYNRDAINTLSAPIDYADFSYVSNFVQAADGSNYTYKNFDRFKPTTNETDNTINPNSIGGQSTKGNLGWWYSTNNVWEPYTPTTGYPYSRETVYRDGTNAPKKQAGTGEAFVMGSNHENSTYISPVIGEFVHYNQVRNTFFTTAQVGALPSVLTNGQVAVVQDENGNELFTMTDNAGNVLITGRPGNDITLNCINTVCAASSALYHAFIQSTDHVYVTPSTTTIQVYTGSTLFYSGPASGFTVSSLGSQWGQVECAQSFTYQNCPATGCSTTTYASLPASIAYFKILADATPVSISGGSYTLYQMDTYNEPAIGLINGNSLNKGYYKVVANSGLVTTSYSCSLTDVAYGFYNQLNQLVASIAPEGVKKLYGSGINNYASLTAIPYVSTYSYDAGGRLISKTAPDKGQTQFVYRSDGLLRFTQDAYQAGNGGSYSYINYDPFGRVVETGQYQPDGSGITYNNSASIADNVTSTGGLTTGTKSDVAMITYDIPDATHGQSQYTQDPANLGGAISTAKKYSSIVDNSPNPINLVSQTWYNYDEEGRVLWSIKYIASLSSAGYKTTDYTYDNMGRLTTEIFEQYNPSETFVQYYRYDPANGQLWKVWTSTSTANTPENQLATLQAKYTYYLQGGLKRMELGTNLQGVDYTYTLQGDLKAINNGNSAAGADPGGDGNNGFLADAFGETLDYYTNDYYNTRATGIVSIPAISASGIPDSYSGNIKAMTWYSVKPPGLGSNSPSTYVYNYDPKYQLTTGTYGTPNFGTTPAGFTPSAGNQEKITLPSTGAPAYDGNGNILNLQRTDPGGASTDIMAYTYTPNTNQLTSISNTGTQAGTYNFSYDLAGRMTLENVGSATLNKHVQYDSWGNVTLVSNDGGPVVAFVYDENGSRLEKIGYNTAYQVNQVTYYYGGVIYTQTVSNGIYQALTPREYQVTGPTGKIAVYLKQTPTYVYELTDHQGNVRAVVSQDGTTQNAIDYYPFGQPMALGGGYRYGYEGEFSEADPETNWNSFQFRMYDPHIGRWVIVDPDDEFFSPYLAMGNDPIGNVDPDGADVGGDDGGDPINGHDECPSCKLMEAVIVTPKGNYTYENFNTYSPQEWDWWVQRELKMGLNPDQMYQWLRQKGLDNEAMNHFLWSSSPQGIHYAQSMAESWKIQGMIAEQIAWFLVPLPGVGKLAQLGSRIIGKRVVTWAGERLLGKVLSKPVWTTLGQEGRALAGRTTAREFGTGIDNAFKEGIQVGRGISGRVLRWMEKKGYIEITKAGKYGADVIGGRNLTGFWWDVTTPGSWARHVVKYGEGGTGLLYTRPL